MIFRKTVQPDCKSRLSSSDLFLLNFSPAPGRTFATFQQQKEMDSSGERGRDVRMHMHIIHRQLDS